MDKCPRMVSMNVPALGVYGMPQMKCGAPIPREHCPFSHDQHTKCPFAGLDNTDPRDVSRHAAAGLLADPTTPPVTDEQGAVVDALRAFIEADPGRMGHRFRPIKAADVEIVQRSNDADRSLPARSLMCWDCWADDTARWNAEQTVGEHAHLMFERWLAVRAAVDRLTTATDPEQTP